MIFKTPDEYEKWKKEWMITGKVSPIKPEKPKPNPVHNRFYTAAATQLGKKLLYLVIFVIVAALFIGILSSIIPEKKGERSPDVGQNAQLFNPDNKAVFIAVTEAAYKAERDAIYAGDQQGLINLMAVCQLFSAPNGTNVLIIDRGFNKIKVRITSGDTKGLSGWVSSELVK